MHGQGHLTHILKFWIPAISVIDKRRHVCNYNSSFGQVFEMLSTQTGYMMPIMVLILFVPDNQVHNITTGLMAACN